MPKSVWIFASVLSALVLFGFAGFTVWQQSQEIDQARAELDAGSNRLTALTNQLLLAQSQNEELMRRNTAANQAQKTLEHDVREAQEARKALEAEMRRALEARKTLENEMRQAIESKEVTISELQGRLTVNILDRIMFDSGEAVLKPEGEEVLRQIAKVLAQFPQRQIHVIGHTDNVPIRAGARNKYASNWELSTARATAAVRFLCEEAGVDPRRLGAVGYGEFHPIADNSTTEGRAKNRRIALVVLSEDLAGSDTAEGARVVPVQPATPAESVTNTPPQTEPPTLLAPPPATAAPEGDTNRAPVPPVTPGQTPTNDPGPAPDAPAPEP